MKNNQKEVEALKKQIDVICEEAMDKAREAVEELPPGKMLTPLDILQGQAAKDVKQGVEGVQKMFIDGLSAIKSAVPARDESGFKELEGWISDHTEDIVKHAQAHEENKGETLQKKLNFPSKYLGLMYQSVVGLSSRGMYKEAIEAITVCITLNPTLYDFWFLYGAILQKMKEHEFALITLQMAAGLEEQNPYPIAYMAKSWGDLKEWDEAKAALKVAQELCGRSGQFDEIKEYCHTLNESIEKLERR